MKKYLFVLPLLMLLLVAGCVSTSKGPVASSTSNITSTYSPITVTCPVGNVSAGSQYSSYVSVNGGSGSGYVFQITGTLPDGMAVNGPIVSGITPINTVGSYPFNVLVQDSVGNTANQECSLNVSQLLYVCSINGANAAFFYTYNQCEAACLGLPDNCNVYTPPKPNNSNIIHIFEGIMLVFVVMVAVAVYLFRHKIVLFFSPETTDLRAFDSAVLFEKTGFYYPQIEYQRYEEGSSHWSAMLARPEAPTDRWPISTKTHALSLDSLFKHNAQPKIIDLGAENKAALAEASYYREANAALQERMRHYLITDAFGLALEVSTVYKYIGQNVHSVNVQPGVNRSGSGVNFGGGVPPGFEGGE